MLPARSPAASLVEPPPIRVMVVDDSAFMRFTLTRRLSEAPGLQVVGSAHDGEEALSLIPQLHPDVVTLDVEMPRLNGLDTLRLIMSSHPLPVIMLSSLTTEGARETVQALTWGAVDFVAKPALRANVDSIVGDLVAKIHRAAGIHVRPLLRMAPRPVEPGQPKIARPLQRRDAVVVIGASTGGPRALNTLLPRLPRDLNAALLIVQHMPAGFTRSLAERLDSQSQIQVREAAPGDHLQAGLALLAPGGFHMQLDSAGQVVLNQNPPVHGVRPSVDVTLASVAQRFGAAVVGVILTGMGSDGTNGAALVRSCGGQVIAEAESSCVVWGMPRSVVEAGAASRVAPLDDIAAAIQDAVGVAIRPLSR